MRRFILHSGNNPEKSYECVLWSNGCVNINIAPEAYKTHFHDMSDFERQFPDDKIEWIDTKPVYTESIAHSVIFTSLPSSDIDSIRKLIRIEVDKALKDVMTAERQRAMY